MPLYDMEEDKGGYEKEGRYEGKDRSLFIYLFTWIQLIHPKANSKQMPSLPQKHSARVIPFHPEKRTVWTLGYRILQLHFQGAKYWI